MSELGKAFVASEQAVLVPASPGAMLSAARQAAGVHIEALAVALKVPVSKLEALEADNYEVLPNAVFVRALASSVCRSLKLDPVPVLALLPQSSVPRLSMDYAGINTAFRDGTEKSRGSAVLAGMKHPAFLAAFVLLLGAAVLALFPRSVTDVSMEIKQQESNASATSTGPISAAAKLVEPTSSASNISAQSLGGGASEPLVQSAIPDPASLLSASVLTQGETVDAKGQLLVLRARSNSWVQVRDVNGITTLQKILISGESVVVPGKAPLSVVVGNAEATEVLVRGKSMDLAPISKDNVARFEVQP